MLAFTLFTITFAVLFSSSSIEASSCPDLPIKQPCSYNDGDASSMGQGKEVCRKHSDKCCLDVDGNCWSKMVGRNNDNKDNDKRPGNSGKKPDFEIPDNNKIKKQNQRFLELRPPNLCEPAPFPTECTPNSHSRYVLEPPMNIPYCVRIPCSLDRSEQEYLDENHKACGSQPGCYFDVELHEYRSEFGPAVLPGVPVCHLAIRRSTFHVHAKEVKKYWGTWNPYYTECTLQTFDQEIRAGPAGCDLIPLLKVFKILPKMAGWNGITSYQCALIDACWRPGEGCFYPVSTGDVVVKSGQRFKYNRYEIVYGRPKCQNWDPRTPYSVLKSYHQCLSAGCSVDASTAMAYYNHLYNIGNTMSPKDHWQFWVQVEAGKIGSYNLETISFWNYKNEPVKSKHVPQPPNIPAPGPPRPAGGSNPFALPLPPGRGNIGGIRFPLPQIPTLEVKKSEACGPVFRAFGYRPCSPPDLPDIHQNTYCPYKPLHVPRFPRLRGSFTGCCEINPCYLSKHSIRKMHSGPSYYYTEWSLFTPCSKSCGMGTRKRYRRCVSHDDTMCTEQVEETQSCEVAKCGRWAHWAPWSPCRGACGISSRKRTCLPPGATCDGEEEESKRCSTWC